MMNLGLLGRSTRTNLKPKLISWITEVHAPKVGALRRAIGTPSKLKSLLITNKVTSQLLNSLCTPMGLEFLDAETLEDVFK